MNDYEAHLIEEVRASRMNRRALIARATVAGFSMSSIAGMLAACGSGGDSKVTTTAVTTPKEASGPPRSGGTLRLGLVAPIAKPDPVTTSDDGAIYMNQVSGEYLVTVAPDYVVQPGLATKWAPSNNGKTWTFALRPNVKFHSGQVMTASDVVATFDRLTDPKGNSSALSSFRGVLSHGSVEAVDDGTVRFHLDTPFVFFPYLVSPFNYGAIVLPKDYKLGSYTDTPNGTGPYILKQYVPQQTATWTKNPDYWGKPLPYLDKVTAKFYRDDLTVALGMQAAEVDLQPNTYVQGARPYLKNPDVKVYIAQGAGYWGAHMRVDTAPFSDVRVRQAIATCLNRPAIVSKLFDGQADVGNDNLFAPVYPDTADVLKQVPQRKQDFALAKKLLADAGHEGGLKVQFITENDVYQLPDYALLMRQDCKQAGIDVDVKLMSGTAYHQNDLWLKAPFGMVAWLPRGSFGQAVQTAYLKRSLWNSAHFANPQFESLVRDYDGQLDDQKRRAVAVQIAKLQTDQVPELISFFPKSVRAARKHVQGISPGPGNYIGLSKAWLASGT